MKFKLFLILILILILVSITLYVQFNKYKPIKNWCQKYDSVNQSYMAYTNISNIKINKLKEWNDDTKINAKILCGNIIKLAKKYCDSNNTKNIRNNKNNKNNLFNKDELIGTILEDKDKIVIVFRGTLSIYDVFVDLKQKLIGIQDLDPKINKNVKIHFGFYNYIKRILETILLKIDVLVKKNKTNHIFIAGHSLGAALATLITYIVSKRYPSIYIYNYDLASPRVGNQSFVDDYNSQKNITTFSIMNLFDSIPNLPSLDKKFEHIQCLGKVDGKIIFNSNGHSSKQNHSVFRYYDNIDKAVFV